MPADEVETRIIFVNERVLTASVNDIEHIENQSLDAASHCSRCPGMHRVRQVI
jgi:hypothetical protein